MTIRCFLLTFLFVGIAEAAEWEHSLATVPALRTSGAGLVSSDALMIEGDRYALITYWESRSQEDVDFYRCVDIADSSFATVRQNCWKALRPTGRGPATVPRITSSAEICGQPNVSSDAASAAFCSFSRTFNLGTPYFEIALSPFDNGGLVAVQEQGRHLIVVDETLPATVLLEVRVSDLADRPDMAAITSTTDLGTAPPEGYQCAIENLAGRPWAICQPFDFPTNVVYYLFEAGMVYQVNFNTDVSPTDLAVLREAALSLQPGSR